MIVDRGMWIADVNGGFWSITPKLRIWLTDCGLLIVDCGLLTVDC